MEVRNKLTHCLAATVPLSHCSAMERYLAFGLALYSIGLSGSCHFAPDPKWPERVKGLIPVAEGPVHRARCRPWVSLSLFGAVLETWNP
jgi:hypothetical protein